MKKIFTLMLAFACALFVGVSCTNDGTSDPTPNPGEGGGSSEPTYAVTIGLAEVTENLPAAGGSVELAYTLSTEYAGEVLTASTTTSWLEVAVSDEQPVVKVTALVNNTAGMTRTGSFTLSYKDAKDLTVSVTQDAAESAFTVEWSNQTPMGATATITANDPEMVFGAFTFGESALSPSDDFMPWSTRADAEKKSPAEYAAEQLALFADPMGYGGLGIGFYYKMQDMSGLVSTMSGNVLNCSLYSWMAPEKKMYLVVVGLNWGLNMETGEDTTTQNGLVHVFEVQSLPQPALALAAESVSASYAEGCAVVDYALANPTEDGVLSAESDCEWIVDVTPSPAGKLHIYCAENPYAKARSAEVQVTYTYNCMVNQYGETYEMPVTATATVKVEQEANPNVKPVTFNITVKETHFDRIVVDVKPSDSEAYYVLGTESKANVNDYAQRGDAWSSVCEYALGEEAHQGTLTNYELKIDTTYATEPEQWIYYVYAFQTNAESSVVACAPTYVETPVTNDSPALTFDVDYEVAPGLTVEEKEDGEYVFNAPAEGGTFKIKYNIKNAPEGVVVRINNTSSDKVSDSNNVLGTDETETDAVPTFNDEEGTMTVVVNPFDSSKTEWYAHYVTIYVRMYTDATKSKSIGKSISLRINQIDPATGKVPAPEE